MLNWPEEFHDAMRYEHNIWPLRLGKSKLFKVTDQLPIRIHGILGEILGCLYSSIFHSYYNAGWVSYIWFTDAGKRHISGQGSDVESRLCWEPFSMFPRFGKHSSYSSSCDTLSLSNSASLLRAVVILVLKVSFRSSMERVNAFGIEPNISSTLHQHALHNCVSINRDRCSGWYCPPQI